MKGKDQSQKQIDSPRHSILKASIMLGFCLTSSRREEMFSADEVPRGTTLQKAGSLAILPNEAVTTAQKSFCMRSMQKWH